MSFACILIYNAFMGTIADPQRLKWNRENFYRLLDVFGVDRMRVELIDGDLIQMPPQKEPHSLAIILADAAMRKAFGPNYTIRQQMPLSLSSEDEPEPDLAVVRGKPRSIKRHPRSAELIIEVADSTLRFDRVKKGSLYAAHKLADYWIVNLLDHQLEVRRDPGPDANAEFGASYTDLSVYHAGDSVAPLARPRNKIRVSDLLP
jgi:Uma2 family endonuclease